MNGHNADDRLREPTKASPNFGRLYGYQPLLAIYGSQAELAVFTNPNAAYVSAGRFGEVPAEEFVARTGTRLEGTIQYDRLNALTREGVLVGWSRDAFDKLRRGRNDAAHHHLFDTTKALEALKSCWQSGALFDRAVGDKRTVSAFVPPTLPAEAVSADPEEVAELQEALDGHRPARWRSHASSCPRRATALRPSGGPVPRPRHDRRRPAIEIRVGRGTRRAAGPGRRAAGRPAAAVQP